MTGTPTRRRSPSAAAANALAPAAVLAVVLLPPLDASAYSYQTCDGGKQIWERNWTNLYISTTSFPSGSSWDARLQNAMWYWNQVKGSRFTFYIGRDTDGRHGSSNGVNEIRFDNTLGGGTLAVTRLRYNCSRWFDWWSLSWKTRRGIIETDIGFNVKKAWNTGPFDHRTTGSPYSFESVALHELGHALGLIRLPDDRFTQAASGHQWRRVWAVMVSG